MHLERKHQKELSLGLHPGLKGREEVEQMEPTEDRKKQQLEQRGKPGQSRMAGASVGKRNEVEAPRAQRQHD